MIYTNAIVLSLLGLTASASGDNNKKMSDYLGYVNSYTKNYVENGEFLKRLGEYLKNDDYIEECNYKATHTDEEDPVFCGHNSFSDWTEGEYLKMLGFIGSEVEDDDSEELKEEEGSGMLGIAEATTVDHTKYMTPVKNQGGCGSCWAFAATTAIEGTIGVNNQEISVRFSEQQSVDCTTDTDDNRSKFDKTYGTYGCGGGWMSNSWKFMKEQGVMSNEDYPYKAKDQTCKHEESKIIGRTKQWGIDGKNNIQKMKERLQKQPGAIALSASSLQFRNYRKGTLKQCCDNTSCDEGTVPINHAVNLVGYSEGSNDKTVRKCSVDNWWVSCKEETEQGEGEEDKQGDKNYWKIQNSWGTGWGDQGFMKIEIQDGQGVCRMNRYGIHWADWDS